MAKPRAHVEEPATGGKFAVLVLMAGAVVLGGASASTSLGGLALQLVSLATLISVLMRQPRAISRGTAWSWLGYGVLALILMHLLPLPSSLWSALPGRSISVQSLDLAHLSLPVLPLSLVPGATVASALAGLPVAVLALLLARSREFPTSQVSKMLVGLTLLSWVLGVLQVLGGPDSPLYFHAITTRWRAVGFFANPNHLATLLVIGTPLVAVVAAGEGLARRLPRKYTLGIVVAYTGLAALGVTLTASVGGIILLGVAVVASLFLIPASGASRAGALGVAVLCAGGAVAFSVGVLGTSFANAQGSRPDIWRTTIRGIEQFWPVGSGLGTFPLVYPSFEDRDGVGAKFINHAHNDYLEVLFESGVVGAALIVAVLGWWAVCSAQAWRRGADPDAWRRASSIIVGVTLLHSIADYPLRTPAILVIVCYFAAVLGAPKGRTQSGKEPHASEG